MFDTTVIISKQRILFGFFNYTDSK